MQVYELADVNGKKFKVGCECVKKTGDVGLIDVVKREIARRKREAKNDARVARQTQLRNLLALDSVKAAFQDRPHPNTYFASQGKTYFDYAVYMLSCGGDSSKDYLFAEMDRLSLATVAWG
jgi:hypothetical protein